jgi:hypothetical protein
MARACHSLHVVPRPGMSRSYTSLSLVACMVIVGQLFAFTVLEKVVEWFKSYALEQHNGPRKIWLQEWYLH